MVRQTNTLLYPCREGRGVYIVFFINYYERSLNDVVYGKTDNRFACLS